MNDLRDRLDRMAAEATDHVQLTPPPELDAPAAARPPILYLAVAGLAAVVLVLGLLVLTGEEQAGDTGVDTAGNGTIDSVVDPEPSLVADPEAETTESTATSTTQPASTTTVQPSDSVSPGTTPETVHDDHEDQPASSDPNNLEGGAHFGYIRSIGEDVISFDLAEFYTGAEAQEAAENDGAEWNGDFYIRNNSAVLRELPFGQGVEVFLVDCSGEGGCVDVASDFIELNARLADFQAIGDGMPVWIDYVDHRVILIREQYLP
jgi:hypothetical protein